MQAPEHPPAPSLWRATLWIAAKEIRTSFRDRQTTLYMVVLPIVIYPLLFWCLIQSALFVQGRREHTEVTLALGAPAGAELPRGLAGALARRPPPRAGNELTSEQAAQRDELERVRIGPLRQPLDEAGAREWLARTDPAEPDEERPDAVLLVPAAVGRDDGGLPPDTRDASDPDGARGEQATLVYDSTDASSDLARERVGQRLPRFAHERRVAELPAGTDERELEAFTLGFARDVAPGESRGAHLLAAILPMLLVVMTVMGAFFPAVDLTAGERERHTAETTLLLPVPRLAVHYGKVLAVCAGAVTATALNLFALALSAGHLLHMWARDTDIEVEVPLGAFLAVAPLALLFALFVSAALTAIASRARTFKEGQALLGPVQLVFIVPAMAGVMPALALTPGLACLPVVNVVLVFRELLEGRGAAWSYALTALSLASFAALSVWIAVRLLSREELYAGARPSRSWWRFARGGRA